MGTATMMFADENQGRFPGKGMAVNGGGGNEDFIWASILNLTVLSPNTIPRRIFSMIGNETTTNAEVLGEKRPSKFQCADMLYFRNKGDPTQAPFRMNDNAASYGVLTNTLQAALVVLKSESGVTTYKPENHIVPSISIPSFPSGQQFYQYSLGNKISNFKQHSEKVLFYESGIQGHNRGRVPSGFAKGDGSGNPTSAWSDMINLNTGRMYASRPTYQSYALNYNRGYLYDGDPGSGSETGGYGANANLTTGSAFRHIGDRMSVLYMDGHAENTGYSGINKVGRQTPWRNNNGPTYSASGSNQYGDIYFLNWENAGCVWPSL